MKDWYNLIETTKTALTVDGAEPLVEDPAIYNGIVNSITWYNLKEKLIELVSLINYDDINLDVNIQWYTIPTNIQSIQDYFA